MGAYGVVFGICDGERLYGLYAGDSRRYEVVQVVGGENGAHREWSEDVAGVATGATSLHEKSGIQHRETMRECADYATKNMEREKSRDSKSSSRLRRAEKPSNFFFRFKPRHPVPLRPIDKHAIHISQQQTSAA
jgi:hypothetical protein